MKPRGMVGAAVLRGVRLRRIGLRPWWFALCAGAVSALLLPLLPGSAAPGYLVFTWWSLLACGVDGAERRLPNTLTLPLALACPFLLAGAAVFEQQPGRMLWMLIGSVALTAIYLVLHLANPAGMGFGDVKLAVSVGAVLGWAGIDTWWAGALLGPLLGAAGGMVLLVRRRRAGPARDPVTVPFGPPMVAGAVAGLVTVGVA